MGDDLIPDGRAARSAETARSGFNQDSTCTTPGCPGDPRYASPGRGHLDVCPYPKPYDGPPLDIEFTEHEGMTEAMAPFMTIIYLFGDAVRGANRTERKALYDARLLLKTTPLAEIAQAIMDARGPDWGPSPETLQAIEALHHDKENT